MSPRKVGEARRFLSPWDRYRGRYQGSLSHSLFAHLISLYLSARLIPAYGFGATRLSVQPNLRTKERGEIGELGIEILQIVVGRNRSIEEKKISIAHLVQSLDRFRRDKPDVQ